MKKYKHIEAKGCIVNIFENLHDLEGNEVTTIEIIPDNNADEKWVLDGTRNNRVILKKEA